MKLRVKATTQKEARKSLKISAIEELLHNSFNAEVLSIKLFTGPSWGRNTRDLSGKPDGELKIKTNQGSYQFGWDPYGFRLICPDSSAKKLTVKDSKLLMDGAEILDCPLMKQYLQSKLSDSRFEFLDPKKVEVRK